MAEKRQDSIRPLILRVTDAATMLSVSEREVWSMLARRELTAIKVPGRRMTRIATDEVERLVARWRGQDTADGATQTL